jgi:flagellar basal body rod protein FlgG
MSSSAMFTAVTGSVAQQIKIDVIANNLANLGTSGFKRIRPQFEDLLYEQVRAPRGRQSQRPPVRSWNPCGLHGAHSHARSTPADRPVA